jgi:hypothetical protein
VVFGCFPGGVGSELCGARLDASLPPAAPAPPAAPDRLTAAAVTGSESALRLTWRDRSTDEYGFEITWVTPGMDFETRSLLVAAGTHEVLLPGFASNVPATFRVRSFNGAGASAWSGEASATPFAAAGPCAASDAALCLLGSRFEARVWWRDQHNFGFGTGHAAPFPGSARTGTFWFFNPSNIELIVKELDGRPVNGHFWTFYGALSDVEYWLTVTDTSARANRTYYNPPSEVCGVGDTASFPGAVPAGGAPLLAPGAGAADATGLPRTMRAVAFEPAPLAAPDTTGPCVPGPETLCLLGGRFRVEVAWHDQHNGGDGAGHAVAGTDKAGYFWFFNSTNVELVVKALDGRTVNGRFWIFYGALSDVEYTITVTDTVAGQTKTYVNQPGDICGRADTAAF